MSTTFTGHIQEHLVVVGDIACDAEFTRGNGGYIGASLKGRANSTNHEGTSTAITFSSVDSEASGTACAGILVTACKTISNIAGT